MFSDSSFLKEYILFILNIFIITLKNCQFNNFNFDITKNEAAKVLATGLLNDTSFSNSTQYYVKYQANREKS